MVTVLVWALIVLAAPRTGQSATGAHPRPIRVLYALPSCLASIRW
jgi:hypothetical protein